MISIYLCFILIFIGTASPKRVMVRKSPEYKTRQGNTMTEFVTKVLDTRLKNPPNILMETIDNMSDVMELRGHLTNSVNVHIGYLTKLIEKNRIPATTNNINNILSDIISNGEKMKLIFQNVSSPTILKAILKINAIAPIEALMAEDIEGNTDAKKQKDDFINPSLGETIKSDKEIYKRINSIKNEQQKNILLREMLFGEDKCLRKKKSIKDSDRQSKDKQHLMAPFGTLDRKYDYSKIDVRKIISPVLVKYFTSRRDFLSTITNSFMNGVVAAIDKIKDYSLVKNINNYIYGDNETYTDLGKYVDDNTTRCTEDEKELIKQLIQLNKNTMKILLDIQNPNLIKQLTSHVLASAVNLTFNILKSPTVTSQLKKLYQDIKSGADVQEKGNKMFDMLYGNTGCWNKLYGSRSGDDMYHRFVHPLKVGSDVRSELDRGHPLSMMNRGRIEWELGVVPYYIDTDSYDSVIADRISSSMGAIADVSCIIFKELHEPPDGQFPWLYFTNPTKEKECVHQMKVGTGGAMNMVLGYNCIQPRHIMHSLFHVLGFEDEVTHPQRDRYIRILWNNIQPKYHALFKIRKPSSKTQTEYDALSVMHFHDRAFSWNGKATIMSLVPGMMISPSERMSQLDEMKLRLSYGHQCKKQKATRLFESCKSALNTEDSSIMSKPNDITNNLHKPPSSEMEAYIEGNDLKQDESNEYDKHDNFEAKDYVSSLAEKDSDQPKLVDQNRRRPPLDKPNVVVFKE